jgi:Na+/melibiose symporter-like transporter
MEPLLKEHDEKLDQRLQRLLDQFERDVEPYDRLSAISMIATPIGVIVSIFLPLLSIQLLFHNNEYTSIGSSSTIYCTIVGILITICVTKLLLFYVDHKKHEISRVKYKPIAGVCMCDLSQLRAHINRMDKSKTMGERMRHAKLVNYYRHQIGWK